MGGTHFQSPPRSAKKEFHNVFFEIDLLVVVVVRVIVVDVFIVVLCLFHRHLGDRMIRRGRDKINMILRMMGWSVAHLLPRGEDQEQEH